MTNALVLSMVEVIGHPSMGIIVPAVIFIISFVAAWLLYRHFSKH